MQCERMNMYSDRIFGKKWASDDLQIVRHANNNWVISFQTRGILGLDRNDEMLSIFCCLIETIDFPCGIIFDFSQLEELNEDELGNFVAISLPFLDCDCRVSVCNMSIRLLELFERLNLEKRFHFAAGQEDALFALNSHPETTFRFENR